MAPSFFPLDEELALLPGALTPTLQAGVVRLGASLPFAEAARHLAWFTGTRVGEETMRRLTETAGAALVAAETAAAMRLEQTAPPPPMGPAVLQMSVDGAMVPLVGGAWGEVKLLVIGEVTPDAAKPERVRTGKLSYFARRAEVGEFVRQAGSETHRRGVETAERVVLLVDGAVWCQEIADLHRPDAVRILDFPHAVEHLTTAAEATFGANTVASQTWGRMQATTLKTGEPSEVLVALSELPTEEATDPAAAAAAQQATGAYLAARWAQIQYAEFREQGMPIGSGAVESGHKRVVLSRMKGAGMRWEPTNINPMVALRGAICSDRWSEAWATIVTTRRADAQQRRADRRTARRAARIAPTPPPPPLDPLPTRPDPVAWDDDVADPPRPVVGPPKKVIHGRPTRTHPWKCGFIGRPPAPLPCTEL